jgi:hypothetical protein
VEWYLVIVVDEKQHNLLKAGRSNEPGYNWYPPEIVGVGSFLSEHTGWPLTPQQN